MENNKINPHFMKMEDIDLDDLLRIGENRKPNHLGLYRLNCLIIGKTGSGKTTTLLKALLTDAIDNFEIIIFIIPRESIESGFYKSLSENVESLNKKICFIIIGEEDLPTIEDFTKISKKFKKRIAVVLDDFINAFSKKEWLIFRRYITQLSRVPYGASLFVLTQNLLEFPTTYRKNFNCFVLFVNSLTLLQFKDIVKSYYDYGNFTKRELEEMYNVFKQDSHTPLWLINAPNEEQSMLYLGNYISISDIL